MSAQDGPALLATVSTATKTVPRVIIVVPASLSFPRVQTIAVAGNSLGKVLTNAESEKTRTAIFKNPTCGFFPFFT